MYQKSPFLLETNFNGKYLVYNCLTHDFIWAKEDNIQVLSDEINCISESADSPLQHYLSEGKYIFDSQESLLQLEQSLYQDAAHSHKELFLIIMPTEKCNFRCVYCYENYQKGAMSPETQEALVGAVKKEMRHYDALRVEWFGGEPLLVPEIIENLTAHFKSICAEQKKPYRSAMTTNGYLLTPEMFKRMKACNVVSYQITLDGGKSIHDKTRPLANGGPTFDVIFNNLLKIKEYEKSPMIYFDIRTNHTIESKACEKEWVELLQNTFLDDKRFAYSHHTAANVTNDPEFEKHAYKPIVSNQDDELNYVISNFSDFDFEERKSLYEKAHNDIKKAIDADNICYAFRRSSLVIGSDGKLYKCTFDFTSNKASVGIINSKKKIFDINSNINQWIFPFFSKEKMDACINCPIYPGCLGLNCIIQKGEFHKAACNSSISKVKQQLIRLSLFDDGAHDVKQYL